MTDSQDKPNLFSKAKRLWSFGFRGYNAIQQLTKDLESVRETLADEKAQKDELKQLAELAREASAKATDKWLSEQVLSSELTQQFGNAKTALEKSQEALGGLENRLARNELETERLKAELSKTQADLARNQFEHAREKDAHTETRTIVRLLREWIHTTHRVDIPARNGTIKNILAGMKRLLIILLPFLPLAANAAFPPPFFRGVYTTNTAAWAQTNVISLSTTNATSKPLTNHYQDGVLTLYGLEAGANITLTHNGSNIVITGSAGAGDAGGTNARQFGTLVLTNLSNTGAVTNIVSLSTTNATSKPLTNHYENGILTLYGIEAGTGTTISMNASNIVISSSVGLTTNANQFLGVPLSIKTGAFLTNMNYWGNGTNHGDFFIEGDSTVRNIFPDIGDTRALGQINQQWSAIAVGGQGILFQEVLGGSDYVRIISPGAIGMAYDLTLPDAQGADGQVITNNGAGLLGWWTPVFSGDAGGTNARQFGTLILTNLSGTGAVTNIVSLSTTNATSKPITNHFENGILTLFGIEQGSGHLTTVNGSNIVTANDWVQTASTTNVVGVSNWVNSVSNYVTAATNSASVTNWINFRQPANAVLSNLVGTAGNNVTNVISLSTTNATSKPITNHYENGVLTLFGLEAGSNVTLSQNPSNIVISSSASGGDSLWSSNNITLFPGMFTNRVAIGTNTVPDGTVLYILGYSQAFPGAQNFEDFAQGSAEAYGLVVMLKPDNYSGNFSAGIQSRNDVENHGGNLDVLSGGNASYGIDCINTAPGSGSQIKGATCGIQGYAISVNSINLGISGVAGPATATSTNIASSGVAIRVASLANTKDVGIYGAVKTTSEITTPATIARSAVMILDCWTSNVPVLVLQTNNGNLVAWVDNNGYITTTNGLFARVIVASPKVSVTNVPGLDRQLTFWNTNGQGYTAFSGPTNDWLPTNRFFLTITNPVADEVLKILSVSYENGVASIQLTNSPDNSGGGGLTTNANQFGASVELAIKSGALMTNTLFYPSNLTGPAIIGTATTAQVTNLVEWRSTNGTIPISVSSNANAIVYGRLDMSNAVAFRTNNIDFRLPVYQAFTNALQTNLVLQLTNVYEGVTHRIDAYGAGRLGNGRTNAWQLFCTVATGTTIYWPPGTTNGNFDVLVNSNQVVSFTFMGGLGSTNILAAYRVLEGIGAN